MKKILFIDVCARPESRTRRLARHVLEQLQGENVKVQLYEEEQLLPLITTTSVW